jgi:hypothetical protein
MATTLLEKMRALHEDIERFERQIVDLKLQIPKTHKESITIDHKVNKYLELIKDRSQQLQALYEDKDGLRRDELVRISGQGPEAYTIFYDMLREIRNDYARYPNIALEDPDDVAWNLVMNDDELSQFTGEEGFGRFLDLHEHHVSFLNLKQNKGNQIDYITYLRTFYKFNDELDVKDRAYQMYIEGLLSYLISFFKRAQPLFDLERVLKEAEEEFNQRWAEGLFRWSDQENFEKKKKWRLNWTGSKALLVQVRVPRAPPSLPPRWMILMGMCLLSLLNKSTKMEISMKMVRVKNWRSMSRPLKRLKRRQNQRIGRKEKARARPKSSPKSPLSNLGAPIMPPSISLHLNPLQN